MKKVFVTGVAGQLGHDVVNELTCRTESGRSSYTCVGSDLARTTAEPWTVPLSHGLDMSL